MVIYRREDDPRHPNNGYRTRNQGLRRRSLPPLTATSYSHPEIPTPIRPRQPEVPSSVRPHPTRNFYRGTTSTNPESPHNLVVFEGEISLQ